MNIHPLFVHFPIAFLCLYSVLECLRFRKLQEQPFWFPLKAVLLIVGSLGAFVALQTGELAEHAFPDASLRNVIDVHSLFAGITTWIYVALMALYIIHWLNDVRVKMPQRMMRAWNGLVCVERGLFKSPILVLLALLGFAGMTITGALGAVLVYGPDVDPAVRFIYRLFFP